MKFLHPIYGTITPYFILICILSLCILLKIKGGNRKALKRVGIFFYFLNFLIKMENIIDLNFENSTPKELLRRILQHEKDYRGIDWERDFFDTNGREKEGFVKNVLDQSLQKVADQFGPIQGLGSNLYVPDNANLLDVLGFQKDALKSISGLKGEKLKIYLLELLNNLQQVEKELQNGSVNWDLVGKLMTAVGAIWTGKEFVAAVMTAWTGEVTFGAALKIALGMGTMTAAATAAIVIVVIVLIAFVIFMVKDAREYSLVINDTDYELRMSEIYRHNGKVDILPTTDKVTGTIAIPPRDLSNPKKAIFGGIFGLRKRTGALYGAEGVIKLDIYNNNKKYPNSSYLGYVVPLTSWFGGPNSCFVKCSVGDITAKAFFNKYEKDLEKGNLESSDNYGTLVKVIKRVNDKSGSEAFAITIYSQG